MATTDVLQDNVIRNGSIVLQPARGMTFSSVSAQRTSNEYPLNQPTATQIENKYTNKFDEVGYYVTPDLIDGNP